MAWLTRNGVRRSCRTCVQMVCIEDKSHLHDEEDRCQSLKGIRNQSKQTIFPLWGLIGADGILGSVGLL